MNLVTRGLVLRSTDYREGDKLLTVLTDTMGKLTVKARGARRRGSRLLPVCQLFAWSEMTLFEYQGRYILDEAELLEPFAGLQKDLTRIALASYFAEVLGAEGDEDRSSGQSLRLMLNSLYALAHGLYPPRRVKAAFELRYMALSGYAPRLESCAVCGREPEAPLLSVSTGLLHCASCPSPGVDASLPLDAASLGAMRYILDADLKKLFSFSLSEPSQTFLERACEAYLLARSDRRFRTLEFYKTAGEQP